MISVHRVFTTPAWWGFRFILALTLGLGTQGLLSAQPAASRSGLVFAIPSPLTSDTVGRIKKAIEDARSWGADRPSLVVFDFNPEEKPTSHSEFGENYTLANYIASLHDLTTVAYVHGKVTGHTVLPVVACKEIVVGDAAQLGEIVTPPEQLTATEQAAYEEIVGKNRPAHFAVIRKMFDPRVQLRRGQKGRADFYLHLAERDAAQKQGVQVTNTDELSAAPDGRIGLLNAGQLRELGLATARADNREQLAEQYGLNAATLRDDWLAGREPVAYRYVLRGRVDAGLKESVLRMLDRVVREKGNILFLQLECRGGDFVAALDLATELRQRARNYRVLIVAFIPDAAPDTAAIIALGCSEIVMSKRSDGGPDASEAIIGDFEPYLTGKQNHLGAWQTSLQELAAQGYPVLLVQGMIDRDLEIVRAHPRNDRTHSRLMAKTEFDNLKEGDGAWVLEKTIKPKGQLLKLTATQAEELGFARYAIASRNPDEMYTKYGIAPDRVRDATPAWLDRFAEFLKQAPVTTLLVVIAFIGLILEMKVPGTAIPGIISALCFILVFWAHTQFSGQVAVLAGLLFLLGLVLLMMEVFVLPGFGVCGITGVLLILGSLALITFGSTNGNLPQTGDEWVAFGSRMGVY
ncbi:MAG: hypothetical protein LC104_07195, partial [Bacteroidales bacterium]|nr:hypothetical protein [Bacteroidales bacterium]